LERLFKAENNNSLMKVLGHIRSGIGFGLTSSIITTLGLMVGLYYGTNSQLAVIGGIITIAVADALSDALAMHISQESEGSHSSKEIWAATFATFGAKFFFAIIFLAPVLLLALETAIIASIALGLALIAIFSYWIALSQKERVWSVVLEHLVIAIAVIGLTYGLGLWIASVFA